MTDDSDMTFGGELAGSPGIPPKADPKLVAAGSVATDGGPVFPRYLPGQAGADLSGHAGPYPEPELRIMRDAQARAWVLTGVLPIGPNESRPYVTVRLDVTKQVDAIIEERRLTWEQNQNFARMADRLRDLERLGHP